MFAIFSLSVEDIIKNRDYLKAEPYFTSSMFENEIAGYSNNIQALNETYKDFSKKSEDEKVTSEELMSSKSLYDSNFINKENEINEKYKNDILEAEQVGNKNKIIRLNDAKTREIEEFKKEDTKTLMDLKKEIIAYKTEDYENIKKAVEGKSNIKYYLTKGKNNVMDTNIADVTDINLYVKNNALYSIKFSQKSLENNIQMNSIYQWLGTSGEIYFIIPKGINQNSYTYKNYIYSNSVRQRIIKEVIIGFVALIIGITFILILRKNNEEIAFIQKSKKWYQKIPLDVKIFIFIFYFFIISFYMSRVSFFYKPYNLGHVYILTVIAMYIFYIYLNFRVVLGFRKNKQLFRDEVKKCLFNNLSKRCIILLTVVFAVSLLGAVITLMAGSILIIIPISYAFCYMLFIIIYSLNKIRFFNNIIKGTQEIVSGNLNYNIEEKGRGDLFQLAHNINNMKASFKKSLENEIKSERLKSELITNVSHDLKTPLTSIINYVDLLKKEGLTKEESNGYIDILDRKSQRLKILIDDLFEASKMASGAVQLNMEKLDVIALLQQALAELDEKINNSSLIFKLKVPGQKVYANLDGKRTWRVFENLINNILKYTLPNTRVYIELLVDGDKIIISMKNISSYEMDFDNEEIFERFIRGDMSRNTEGSGLGLSIAKSILELQGGNLSIEIDGDLFKAKVIVPLFTVEG
ncbi:HAMP domain-containing histidine kinase [Clostridium lacusfryxellense]|nr:HAMP domain-containing sensor histidine kinase [Clostridium lacusfryxellense]MBU3109956.1 HAMP domain-containing histidine kinase [Clostridium lacusfryxellense]